MLRRRRQRQNIVHQSAKRADDADHRQHGDDVAAHVDEADPGGAAELRPGTLVDRLKRGAILDQAVPGDLDLEKVLYHAGQQNRPQQNETKRRRLHRRVDQLAAADHRTGDDNARADRGEHAEQTAARPGRNFRFVRLR